MMMMMMISLLTLFISCIMLFLWILISKKNNLNQEKSSPFECGFDPLSLSRLPFSIHFFLVSMIFLIFDIEIALLIPLVYLMNKFSLITLFSTLFFLMILLLGLYIEYIEKSIEWKK